MRKLFFFLFFLSAAVTARADNGYKLWLRFDKISNPVNLKHYQSSISNIVVAGTSPTSVIAKQELQSALEGLLGKRVPVGTSIVKNTIVAGTPANSRVIASINLQNHLRQVGEEGFVIHSTSYNGKNIIAIAANSDVGVLYGVYYFLRMLQTGQTLQTVNVISSPKIKLRLLNHWDNLDRHVERGYAGNSIWDWHRLPGYISQRYIEYARANASIGINGTVLTNVNANAIVLTNTWLQKVAALANVFRPYGIKVYLTARFSAPIEIGGLKTADPANPEVQQWWKEKAKEIYSLIPDFGGFLVKANSEGQPGPQNYKRNHDDGANMLADAVAPFGGVVMWRAFVYSNETPEDRFKQASNEFKPLDGKFRSNVLIQVKNGPIDFQPREPFSPLFGAMPKTPLMMELQITQEYLGQATHLVYEAPMFKEVLDADTYQQGKGSYVSSVIDGQLHHYPVTGMAGVSNIGSDINWTGHLFGQANWYCLGRLAWDHSLSSEQVADEWLRQTFTSNPKFLAVVKRMMLGSHQAMVNYMTPLGLNHIMGTGHHYGPAPWVDNVGRADWNPVYYHRADEKGIGFDRTATGSNALAQYAPEVRKMYEDVNTCPEEYLLWFHHVSWDHRMRSGRTLWEELCHKYNEGVDSVRAMQKAWKSIQPMIDKERFDHVRMLLNVQEEEAVCWRDACLLYFQTFSKQPIPARYEQPRHTLEHYKSLRFPYAPGNG